VFAHDLSEFLKIAKELEKSEGKVGYIEQYRELMKANYNIEGNVYPPLMYFENCDRLKNRIINIQNQIKNIEEAPDKYLQRANICFITLYQTDVKENIIHMDKRKKFKLFKIKKIKVEEADMPDDIRWENLNYTSQSIRSIASFIIAISVVTLGFLIEIYIDKKQDHLKEEKIISYKYTLLFSSVMTIIHMAIETLIPFLSKQEKHLTKTQQLSSISFKTAFSAFLNAAVAPLIFNWNDSQVYSSNGLVDIISSNLFFMLFVTPVLDAINIQDKVKRIIAFILEKRKVNISQSMANKMVMPPKQEWSTKYSNIIFWVLYTIFYELIWPPAVLVLAAGLAFNYWIGKYITLRTCKKPPTLSAAIGLNSANSIIIGCPLIAISNILFTALMDKPHIMYSIIPLCISLAFMIFGLLLDKYGSLVREIKGFKKFLKFLNYKEVRFQNNFSQKLYDISTMGLDDYKALNPITKNAALVECYDAQIKQATHQEERDSIIKRRQKLNRHTLAGDVISHSSHKKKCRQNKEKRVSLRKSEAYPKVESPSNIPRFTSGIPIIQN
jgi:hypothetical protein